MSESKIIKNRWLHVRLDEAEYNLLLNEFKKTTETHLSKYARKVLFRKPVIARTRDESLKDIIETLSKLQKDLNGIGNNYNQMLHKLHLSDSALEVKRWIVQYELEKKMLFEQISTVKEFIAKSAAKWLQ